MTPRKFTPLLMALVKRAPPARAGGDCTSAFKPAEPLRVDYLLTLNM
jgi:hypothetical protein